MNKPSVQFSCSVVSDSLQPHESQHTRPPCPSPTPRVHPNSCASSQWCHPSVTHPTNVKNEGVKVLVTQSCLCDSMDYSPPGSSVHGWTLLCSDVNVLYDEKNWLIGKDPDAGKDWRREETGTAEDEMGGWHHWLNGHGSGWTLGVGDEQGCLVCCSPWGHKELYTTERLNWTAYLVEVSALFT